MPGEGMQPQAGCVPLYVFALPLHLVARAGRIPFHQAQQHLCPILRPLTNSLKFSPP